MEFYLEGIHCAACLWLLEKLPQFVPGVGAVRLDLNQSTARVELLPNGGSFASVSAEFRRMGYPAHPVRGEEAEDLQKKENRSTLMRIGVAAAAMGNIMLLAVSIYAGAEGALAQHFNEVSALLFLPVLLYSCVPFYRSALAAIRTRTVSIDVPVVLAVFLATTASTVNLFRGSGHVYFDSLAAFTFLLLSSRYVLARTQQAARARSRLAFFLAPSTTRRLRVNADGAEIREECASELLVAGDLIEVRSGETLPADGVVEKGRSRMNCAWLTGESQLTETNVGHPVFAGTVNEGAPLVIRVSASGYQTRLGQILRSIEQGEQRKAPVVLLADKISRHFVTAVVTGSIALFVGCVYFGVPVGDAFNRALALVIVTCPCALALATPLAMTEALGAGARANLLIKGADALERLSAARRIYLDKTGTLTQGRLEVVLWKSIETGTSRTEAELAALALEGRSSHPIARAVVRKFSAVDFQEVPEPENFQEIAGHGVAGTLYGSRFELRAASGVEGISALEDLSTDEQQRISSSIVTRIALVRDGRAVALAWLGDEVRSDSHATIRKIEDLGLEPWILTGDSEEPALAVARAVGIPAERVIARATPEDKARVVSAQPGTVMVGDGANDAFALSRADVGVAVHGGMEVSLKAADCYLAREGTQPVYQLLVLGRKAISVVRRNLALSLAYNFAGSIAAFLGHVDPLFAAILMPASALTVFLSSKVSSPVDGARA